MQRKWVTLEIERKWWHKFERQSPLNITHTPVQSTLCYSFDRLVCSYLLKSLRFDVFESASRSEFIKWRHLICLLPFVSLKCSFIQVLKCNNDFLFFLVFGNDKLPEEVPFEFSQVRYFSFKEKNSLTSNRCNPTVIPFTESRHAVSRDSCLILLQTITPWLPAVFPTGHGTFQISQVINNLCGF